MRLVMKRRAEWVMSSYFHEGSQHRYGSAATGSR